jgi:PAS domain S-box-containing protein
MDRLLSVFDGMFEGVWLVAEDGRTTYSNAAMARLLGSRPESMRGRRITDFLDEAVWSDVEAFLKRHPSHAGEGMEVRFDRADGGVLAGLVAGSPVMNHQGGHVGMILNVTDVTGSRSIDAQMARTQRLEAIGLFTAGIVHDFNNLLTAIRGFTELACASLPEGDAIRDDLELVVATTERATAVTRQLLTFTRRQMPVPIDVDPSQVVADVVPMLRPMMGEDIDVVLDIKAENDFVRADPTQLEQVIVNLALNARDAMPAGGTVTIAVLAVQATDAGVADHDSGALGLVRISVSDTGTGMDDETKARIFEPFFTTKSAEKGTGLGLSTVFAIVAQSGGQVQVQSAPGAGSAFHVDLPRVLPLRLPRPRILSAPVADGHGVVLLVEDEPAVREFARRTLEAAGHTVLAAEDGAQALRASERWGEVIDVLVTDIAMPGIHGVDLAVKITQQRPGIHVLFASGYGPGALDREGSSVSGAFLPKPYSGEALCRAVARSIRVGRPVA